MPSLKALFGDTVGRLVFPELTVDQVRDTSPSFRRLVLTGASLRDARFAAGDKVQVFLPGVGPRTYSPFGFDRERGAFELVVYTHGETPGAQWGRRVASGDRARVFGPRGSLPLASLRGPVVLFGDEASFGVAKALVAQRSAGEVDLVFEVSHRTEAAPAADELGLPAPELVERASGDRHLTDVAAHLRAALVRRPDAHLVMTGKAQSIQSLRAGFRTRPVVSASVRAKAYWSVGKRGLD